MSNKTSKNKESGLAKFKKEYLELIERLRKDGKKITTWKCNHCKCDNETVQPTKKNVGTQGYWDGLKTCYDCGYASYVKTYPNGVTEAEII